MTVVNFICKERQVLFHAGQRVRFNWTVWENYEIGGEFSIGLIYHGTVIEEHGLRFIVRVDDGPSVCEHQVPARETFKAENLVIKVKPSVMAALDEPDRALCAVCSGYEGERARCQGWGRVGAIDSYWPVQCMALEAERKAA